MEAIWHYRVKPERRQEFELHYGSDGTWARLFRNADGYLGTDLLRDLAEPTHYVTIDRWKDEESFRNFMRDFADEYVALDRQMEELTTEEERLG